VFAKKIILANGRLLATAGIVLLFFALVDRIPDDPRVFKERGFQSAQSLRASLVASEPGIVGAARFLGRDYFIVNCRLRRELRPEIILSFASVTGISLAADSSPPVS
jgi:hypothetical protein